MMTDDNSTISHRISAPQQFFFRGQVIHFLLLVVLLAGAWALVDFNHLTNRHLFGLDGRVWFVIALFVPVFHQVFVWLAWRSELCFGTFTKWFGSKAFPVYRFVFFCLFLLRPVSLVLLAVVDHDSLEISIPIRIVICLVLGVLAAYMGYSVVRYFGMSRASGADHFDESYRKMPMVKKGMFRFSSNAMYTYAFLLFWIIAVAGASWAAFVVAGFSHVYIWVHYFCTERPDMKLIYGTSTPPEQTA